MYVNIALKADLGHNWLVNNKNQGATIHLMITEFIILSVTDAKQNPPLGKDFLVLFHL